MLKIITCILCVVICHTQAMQIRDIESSEAYEKFLSRPTNKAIKRVEKYRKKVTEQIALRVLNFGFSHQKSNLASARLYYQDNDTENEEKSFTHDILLTEDDNFLWSSNQQVSNALNVSDLRDPKNSIPFDKAFYRNFFISGLFYEKDKSEGLFFKSKDRGEVNFNYKEQHTSIPKSFMGTFYQEVLHSEQFILYMLTNKIHKDLLNQDDIKIFNDVGKVSLVIISRFGPCENCLHSLTSAPLHKKILDSIGSKENVLLNILFFYLNDSNLYSSKNKSETGKLKFFTNDHNRMVVIHPTAFIKNKSIL